MSQGYLITSLPTVTSEKMRLFQHLFDTSYMQKKALPFQLQLALNLYPHFLSDCVANNVFNMVQVQTMRG